MEKERGRDGRKEGWRDMGNQGGEENMNDMIGFIRQYNNVETERESLSEKHQGEGRRGDERCGDVSSVNNCQTLILTFYAL